MKNLVLIIVSLIMALALMLGCSDSQSVEDIRQFEQFVKIEFQYGFRNELNTYEGYYQKDLVQDGVIRVEFWLKPEDQQRIIDKAEQIGFFDFPDEFVNESGIYVSPDPLNILKIKYEDKEHQTQWRHIPEEYSSPEYKKVREFGGLIHGIVESYPEYQKLPEPNGGYD